MKDDTYDEDLETNPFFESVRRRSPELFRRALDEKLYIFVPRKESCKGMFKENTPHLFERHIVRLVEEPDGNVSYANLEGDSIEPSDDGQTLTLYLSKNDGDCTQAISVRVLFEETYFTEDGCNCKLLCISRPFVSFYDGDTVRSGYSMHIVTATTSSGVSSPVSPLSIGSAGSSFSPTSSDPFECYQDWLFGADEGTILRKQLRKNLLQFTERITNEYRPTWHSEQLKILVKEEFFTTFKEILAQKRRSTEKLDNGSISRLQIATEIYFFRCVHTRLMSLLCACLRDEESLLNKTKRAAADLPLSEWGIAPEIYSNLPTARSHLSKLDEQDTPFGKLQCLRKAMASVVGSVSKGEKRIMLSTDDLIPPLAFLIAKSSIYDWVTNIVYMSEFHFSSFANDELAYCLASFEAAAQFIKDGSVKQAVMSKWRDWALGKTTDHDVENGIINGDTVPPEGSLVDTDYWERMTAALQSGDESAVRECIVLTSGESDKQNCGGNRCINSATVNQFTALHFAALFGQTSMLHYLIKSGADSLVDNGDECGRTPLHWACRVGSQSCTLLLLHHGAKSNIPDHTGDRPLHFATDYGHVDCVKALLYFNQQVRGSFAGVNSTNNAGEAPLHIAVRFHHVEIVSVLLECGANVKLPDAKGRTPHELCTDYETRRLLGLVPSNLDINNMDRNQAPNMSPSRVPEVDTKDDSDFMVTVSSALVDLNIEKIDKLLKAVADNDLPLVKHYLGLRDGYTRSLTNRCHPLCQCPKCEDLDEVGEEGINVNATGSNGLNCAHTAVLSDHLDLLRFLVDTCGADVNWPSAADGRTCLHLAAIKGNIQILSFLIEKNANLEAKDSSGDTPLQLITSSGDDHLLHWIRDHLE